MQTSQSGTVGRVPSGSDACLPLQACSAWTVSLPEDSMAWGVCISVHSANQDSLKCWTGWVNTQLSLALVGEL